MRCRACDQLLTDNEACLKFPPDSYGHVDYADLCYNCYRESVEDWEDLPSEDGLVGEEEEEDDVEDWEDSLSEV
jgi:hypothetical protein